MLNTKLLRKDFSLNKEVTVSQKTVKAKLKEILLSGQNTVLIAPLNATKKSLFQKILSDTRFIGSYIDLTSITQIAHVHTAIQSHVSELIDKIKTVKKQTVRTAVDKAYSFNFRLNDQISDSIALDNIMNLLKQLDVFSEKMQQPVVLFFEEFQKIATLEHCRAVEGAIRHAVQLARFVTYIFSGTNEQDALGKMFNDSYRPFYHLCRMVYL